MSFVAGDLVRVKSGGPLMTVEKVGETSAGELGVWCVWFEKVGQRQESKNDVFAPVVLEKSEKPQAAAYFPRTI